MSKRMTLSTKLITLFLLVGVLPALIVGVVTLRTSAKDMKDQKKVTFGTLTAVRDTKKAQLETYFAERQGDMAMLAETVGTLRQEAFKHLKAIGAIKKEQIETYFKNVANSIRVLKDNPTTTEALKGFGEAFAAEGGKTGGQQWTAFEKQYGTTFSSLVEDYGYYDVFLITREGDVVYSVTKESDLGENLLNGNLKTSGLAQAFQNAQSKDIVFADFAPYAPSGNKPAAFMAGPVTDTANQHIGVVAIQVPLNQINAIMQERTGMGQTGESYLVGADKRMRSDSYLDPEGHSVEASFAGLVERNGCDTVAVDRALSGKNGAEVIIDYNGNPVLSAYAPVAIEGVTWAILAEIDVAEAFCPVDAEGNEYFADYIEQYGYYDLFLINPDGHCFYTVAREPDYQTNLVNGKYSGSNLGQLVRSALQTQGFGFVDFAPYAPSNGAPAAFVAQPITHAGTTELIVALQLPLDAINAVMQTRSGMGQTGESYLVGPDKLMRSDSFLDQTGRSVTASFAGTVENNGVDTEASRQALAGTVGAKIVIDYNGNSVLSSYAPVDVFGTTWAIIAEVDEAEAYAGLRNLQTILSIIGIVAAVVITAISVFFARSISKPIQRIIAGLTEGSEQVSSAAGQVSSASQSLAEGATEQAAGLEETSSSLEEMSSMTKQNADNAQQANALAGEARKAADTGSDSMGRMNQAIQDIQKSSDETAKIIKVIDEIAFQTNLLALNAAVEAARAGEAGKGFAVVAEEVRNLAMRSAEAAKNTSSLIEESVKNSNNGVDIAQEVGKVLGEIVQSVGKTTDLVSEIAAASQEQAQGIDQVNTAVAQMDKVTQQNAANAEESASASEELSAQAGSMSEIVGQLVALVGGSGTKGRSKASKSRGKTGGRCLSHADRLYHDITVKPSQEACGTTAKATADQVIPLGADSELDDFNQ